MSVQKYTSNTKTIDRDNKTVYDRFSNWEFLSTLFNPENLQKAQDKMGEKSPNIKIENFTSDSDSCQFDIPKLGTMGMRIIEKEENKTIKVVSDEGSLLKFTLWIQLLPINSSSCKMRLTLHTELNMMMKMVIGNKLEKGIDQIADGLANVPFGNIDS